MSDLKERFKQLADYYELSVRKLEQKFMLQRGNISNLTGAIGSDKLSKIYDNCPEINLTWLITGNGSMILKKEDHTVLIDPQNPTACLLLDRIEKLVAENTRLKDRLDEILTQKKYRNLAEPTVAAEPELKDRKQEKNKESNK